MPHLMYGIEIWYGITQFNDDRVFKLQKKSIRAINCLPYASHTNDYFKSMNLLKLEDLYKQRVLIYMYRSELIHNTRTHDYSTRNAHNITLPLFNKSKSQRTIFYKGIVYWNNLPTNAKNLRSENMFKNAIKLILIGEY